MKENQSELKTTITEMKNTLGSMNRRLNDTKKLSNIKDKIMKIIQSKQQNKNENSLREHWDKSSVPTFIL